MVLKKSRRNFPNCRYFKTCGQKAKSLRATLCEYTFRWERSWRQIGGSRQAGWLFRIDKNRIHFTENPPLRALFIQSAVQADACMGFRERRALWKAVWVWAHDRRCDLGASVGLQIERKLTESSYRADFELKRASCLSMFCKNVASTANVAAPFVDWKYSMYIPCYTVHLMDSLPSTELGYLSKLVVEGYNCPFLEI